MGIVYLHIGIEKTGSTAIQNYLYENKDLLFIEGKVYPLDLFNSENHMELSSLVLSEEKLVNMTKPVNLELYRKNFIQFIKNNKKNDIYFSSEHLSSRVVSCKDIERFIEIISSEGHEIIVLAFYRRPETWIRSHYIQYIASGGVVSFAEYISSSLKNTLIADTTNFSNSLINWNKVLNSKSYKLILEDFDSNKKNLLQKYCDKVSLEFIDENSDKKLNISLTEGQAVVQRAFNRLFNSKKLQFKFKLTLLKIKINFLSIDWKSDGLEKYLKKQNTLLLSLLRDKH